MISVRQIAEAIVDREGGYVHDPDDPGGPTKFGVTLETLTRLGLDLTNDGRIDARDVQALGRNTAVNIFIEHYFYAPRIDALPSVIQPSVFDMFVNSGANAIKILQRLINDMRINIQVDGIVGPKTISATFTAEQAAPEFFADAYGIARRNYYYALGDARPASRKYARRRDGGKGGWIRRSEEFISPQFHLSDAEHRARVSEWL